jgi:hypothetical protein
MLESTILYCVFCHMFKLYSIIMLFAPLFLLMGGAQALPWNGAEPTKHLESPLRYNEPPKPTEAVDLRKRQAPGDVSCAWQDGIGTSSK